MRAYLMSLVPNQFKKSLCYGFVVLVCCISLVIAFGSQTLHLVFHFKLCQVLLIFQKWAGLTSMTDRCCVSCQTFS